MKRIRKYRQSGRHSSFPKQLLLMGSLCFLFTTAGTQRAQAQWVVVDPAHIAESVLNGLRLVDQIKNQVQQIRNEVEMLKKLPSPPWRQIQALTQQLDNLMRQGEAVAYSTNNLLSQFGIKFPGFQAYINWSTEQRRQFEATLDTYRNVLLSLRQQGQHFAQSQAELQAIKNRMGSVTGQTAAIEMSSTLEAFSAEELVLIRQLLAAQTNALVVQASYGVSRDAQITASREMMYKATAAQPRLVGNAYTGF